LYEIYTCNSYKFMELFVPARRLKQNCSMHLKLAWACDQKGGCYMKIRWIMFTILFGLASAGCSSSPHMSEPTAITPNGATEEATTSSAPLAVTVRPPAIFFGPVQSTPPGFVVSTSTPIAHEGWETFSSPALGIAVDYPSDWSVSQQTDRVTFTSPQGSVILLQIVTVNGNNDQVTDGNQDCTTLINSYGLTADVCSDITTSTYSAKFKLESTDGSTRWLTLSTINHEALDTYKVMLSSARRIP
jgi:hypothetical protein